MINDQLVGIVLGEIAQLEKEYQNSQGMILTEDDLKCQLFGKIRALIPQSDPTFNPEIMGSSLHAEVKFFDEEENLTLRPDMSIINPAHLSVFHSLDFEVHRGVGKYKQYSSKSFEIGGSAILIELKFCRDKNGISDKDILFYQADLEKIKRLQNIIQLRSNSNDQIYGVVALFNKTDIGREKFDALVKNYEDQRNLHVVYATGKVNFSGKNPDMFDHGFHLDYFRIC